MVVSGDGPLRDARDLAGGAQIVALRLEAILRRREARLCQTAPNLHVGDRRKRVAGPIRYYVVAYAEQHCPSPAVQLNGSRGKGARGPLPAYSVEKLCFEGATNASGP